MVGKWQRHVDFGVQMKCYGIRNEEHYDVWYGEQWSWRAYNGTFVITFEIHACISWSL